MLSASLFLDTISLCKTLNLIKVYRQKIWLSSVEPFDSGTSCWKLLVHIHISVTIVVIGDFVVGHQVESYVFVSTLVPPLY